MTDEDACRIAQDFLDRQGEATILGDVEATLEWCDIPCTLESIQGRAVVMNKAEMRTICVAFIEKLKSKQLMHLVRHCLEATFKQEDVIWAAYETRYVRDGQLLSEDPYAGFVIPRRRRDRWKISTMQFAVSSNSPANISLRDWAVSQDAPPAFPK